MSIRQITEENAIQNTNTVIFQKEDQTKKTSKEKSEKYKTD